MRSPGRSAGRLVHLARDRAQRARQRVRTGLTWPTGRTCCAASAAALETDARLAAYVTDRLSEGWTPEQIAGRLRLGIEPGLRAVCAETIYGWIYRAGQKTERLWRFLTRHHARRRKRHGRASRDTIAEKTHISQRAGDADARETVGHWEADLVICKRSRPVLVLHERKTRITLMTRLAGKTAAETIAAMTATFRRLDPRMRGSVTFDNDTCFARHMLLRGMLSATTYFCDAYASWQKGGVENANGRIRRWLPRGTDLDEIGEQDIQEIAMTINPLPGRGFMETSRRSPRANASDTDPPSRRSCLSLAGMWKSGLLDPLRFVLESTGWCQTNANSSQLPTVSTNLPGTPGDHRPLHRRRRSTRSDGYCCVCVGPDGLRFVAAGCSPSSGDKPDKEESAGGFRFYGDCGSDLGRSMP